MPTLRREGLRALPAPSGSDEKGAEEAKTALMKLVEDNSQRGEGEGYDPKTVEYDPNGWNYQQAHAVVDMGVTLRKVLQFFHAFNDALGAKLTTFTSQIIRIVEVDVNGEKRIARLPHSTLTMISSDNVSGDLEHHDALAFSTKGLEIGYEGEHSLRAKSLDGGSELAGNSDVAQIFADALGEDGMRTIGLMTPSGKRRPLIKRAK